MVTFFRKRNMSGLKIRIQAKEQLLHLMQGDKVILRFPVSTSRFGLGETEGSFRTPTGRFCIHENIGAKQPAIRCSEGEFQCQIRRIARRRKTQSPPASCG